MRVAPVASVASARCTAATSLSRTHSGTWSGDNMIQSAANVSGSTVPVAPPAATLARSAWIDPRRPMIRSHSAAVNSGAVTGLQQWLP